MASSDNWAVFREEISSKIRRTHEINFLQNWIIFFFFYRLVIYNSNDFFRTKCDISWIKITTVCRRTHFNWRNVYYLLLHILSCVWRLQFEIKFSILILLSLFVHPFPLCLISKTIDTNKLFYFWFCFIIWRFNIILILNLAHIQQICE